jgi:hypothetical protein
MGATSRRGRGGPDRAARPSRRNVSRVRRSGASRRDLARCSPRCRRGAVRSQHRHPHLRGTTMTLEHSLPTADRSCAAPQSRPASPAPASPSRRWPLATGRAWRRGSTPPGLRPVAAGSRRDDRPGAAGAPGGFRVPLLRLDEQRDGRRRTHTRLARRHGGLSARRPGACGPQPRAQPRARLHRSGVQPGGRRRDDHHGFRPRRGRVPRVLRQPRRHDPQLCRRGDPLGHLAHLRGDLQRDRWHPARLPLRGPVRRQGQPRPAQGDGPVQPRGRRDRPRDRLRLRDRGPHRRVAVPVPADRPRRPSPRAARSRR